MRFLKKHFVTFLVSLLWFVIVGIFIWYLLSNNISLSEFLFSIYRYIWQYPVAGILVFLVVYMIRPLVFIPATPMVVFAGMIFGFLGGTILVSVANVFSAVFSYYVGVFTGGKIFEGTKKLKKIKKLKSRIDTDTFSTISLMRLLLFPFDLTNYLCGVAKIPVGPYTVATFLASIPSTAIFVLAGAAFQGQDVNSFWEIAQNVNYTYLLIASWFFMLSLFLARYFQKKYKLRPF